MARPANESVLPFPPYGSFMSFLNDLNAMEVLPNRLNLQVFSGSYSGSAKQQILRALRFFDLMDEAGVPNESALRPLLNPETREAPLSALLRQHYSALIDLPLETAGPAEVNEWFNAVGMDAATTRKAKSFFLTAAKSNGIKMHSLVVERTRKGGGGVRRKRNKGGKATPQNGTPAPEPGTAIVQQHHRDHALFHPAIDAFLREARKLTEQDSWTKESRDFVVQGFTTQLDLFLPVKAKTRTRRESANDDANSET